MAKIQEQLIVIKLSKLIKDSEPSDTPIVGGDVTDSLDQVVQQLVGDNVVVEVETN